MQPLSDRTAGFTDSVIRRMTRISRIKEGTDICRSSATAWARSRILSSAA